MRIPEKVFLSFAIGYCVLLTFLVVCFVLQNMTGIPQLNDKIINVSGKLQESIDDINNRVYGISNSILNINKKIGITAVGG